MSDPSERSSPPADTSIMVSLRGVTKRYGDATVLSDVSFDVRRGRIVGLLGRNGAGKTTTLRILLGLCRPDAGTVEFADRQRDRLTPRRIGVALDTLGFCAGATVRRELAIWARAIGVDSGRVEEVLRTVELTDHVRTPCPKLSTGQRQRLRLATALLSPDVELLILDEPTNGLDPEGIRWLRRLVRSMADRGVAVLLSSHALAEVEQVVDDVLLLERTLLHDGSLEALTDQGARSLEDRFFDIVEGSDAR